VDVTLKLYALIVLVLLKHNCVYKADYSKAFGFQTRTVSNLSPLNFLIFPNWLSVKFHYSLIGLKVKILNTVTLLAAIYLTLFPMSNSYEPLYGSY
jgi:hypothetical protein